jgi:tetratricopeptide (TPR) repeat protein
LALADLGIMHVYEGDALHAVSLLEEALALLRQVGDSCWEADLLGELGLATAAAGQHDHGLWILEQELTAARTAADPSAEKRALAHLGLTHSRLRHPDRALDFFAQALTLARDLGDWQHETELLWYMAIQHAVLGDRDAAIAQAQNTVTLLLSKGKPQAAWFAHHLQAYRDGTSGLRPGEPSTTTGPHLLDMAFSAANSMARFLGSRFQTASAETRDRRLRTCSGCEHHTGLRCRVCGCFTGAKAALAHEECPLGKWPA